MLTDSQWSQKVTIPLGGPGGGGGGGGGRGGGFGGGRGRGGGDGFGAPPRRMTLTVSWRSALPVKQALVRSQIGVDAPISLEQQQFLAQLEPLYVVSRVSTAVRPYGPRSRRLACRDSPGT